MGIPIPFVVGNLEKIPGVSFSIAPANHKLTQALYLVPRPLLWAELTDPT